MDDKSGFLEAGECAAALTQIFGTKVRMEDIDTDSKDADSKDAGVQGSTPVKLKYDESTDPLAIALKEFDDMKKRDAADFKALDPVLHADFIAGGGG